MCVEKDSMRIYTHVDKQKPDLLISVYTEILKKRLQVFTLDMHNQVLVEHTSVFIFATHIKIGTSCNISPLYVHMVFGCLVSN